MSVTAPRTSRTSPTSERAISGLTEGSVNDGSTPLRRRLLRPPRGRPASGCHAQTSTTTGKTIGRRFVCS